MACQVVSGADIQAGPAHRDRQGARGKGTGDRLRPDRRDTLRGAAVGGGRQSCQGTAAQPMAPPDSFTATSSVGLPRESRISLALIV